MSVLNSIKSLELIQVQEEADLQKNSFIQYLD